MHNTKNTKKNIIMIASHKRFIQSFARYFIEKYRSAYNITLIYDFDDEELIRQLNISSKFKIKITSVNPITWYLGCIQLKKIIQQNNHDIIVQNNYIWTYNKYIFNLAKKNNMECWLLNDSAQGKQNAIQYLIMQYNASAVYGVRVKYLILIFRLIRASARKILEFMIQLALIKSYKIKKYNIDKVIYFSESDLRLLFSNGLRYHEKEKIELPSVHRDAYGVETRKKVNAILLDSTGINFYKNPALLNKRLKLIEEISAFLKKNKIKLTLRPHPEYRNEFISIFNNIHIDNIEIDRSNKNLIDVFENYEIIIGGTSTALDEAAFIYGSDDQKLVVSIDRLIPYEYRGICRHEDIKICNDLNEFYKCISSLYSN